MNDIDQQAPNALVQVLRGGTVFRRIHLFLAAALHWPVVTAWFVFMDRAFPIGGQHKTLFEWASIGALIPLYFTIDALMRMKRQGANEGALAPAVETCKAATGPGLCLVTADLLLSLLTLKTGLIAAHPEIPATLSILFSAGFFLAPSAFFFQGFVYAATRILNDTHKPNA